MEDESLILSVTLMLRGYRPPLMTNPVLEIGSTISAVIVFIVVIILSDILGMGRVGSLAALVIFVLLLGGAGYLIAENTYE